MAFDEAAATSLECRALEALPSSIAGFWARGRLRLLGGGLPVSTSPRLLRSSKPRPGVDERLLLPELLPGAGEVARGVTREPGGGLAVGLLLAGGLRLGGLASLSESASESPRRLTAP